MKSDWNIGNVARRIQQKTLLQAAPKMVIIPKSTQQSTITIITSGSPSVRTGDMYADKQRTAPNTKYLSCIQQHLIAGGGKFGHLTKEIYQINT